MQGGCGAKRLRVYLPRNRRPEHGRTVRQAVDTYAIFGFRRRFLQPQDTAFLGFFDRNEPAFASRSLKCLKLFHGASSIGSFPLERRSVKDLCD